MTDADASKTQLLQQLDPLITAIAALDLADPGAARAALDARFPLDGPVLTGIRAAVTAGLDAGWLCPRENAGIRFGRLAKAGPDTAGLGIDAVAMHGPGPGHVHPTGEVDLCFDLAGQPRFDGNAPGWTVYGPGTWHEPTVRDGEMVILYFLPDGAIHFGPAPA